MQCSPADAGIEIEHAEVLLRILKHLFPLYFQLIFRPRFWPLTCKFTCVECSIAPTHKEKGICHGGLSMTATMCFEDVMRKAEAGKASDMNELVRGCDLRLVEELTPIVRHESVSLDLTTVARIDAAGIAALISLYRIAHEAGHCFSVLNAAPHVAELLRLVGLDGFLLSHDVALCSQSGPMLAGTAA